MYKYISNRLSMVPWLFLGVILTLSLVGVLALYSASNGSFEPWAYKHMIRAIVGFIILLIIIIIFDVKNIMNFSYFFYIAVLLLLLAVEFLGFGSGSKRWISLGFINLQPSELMKLAVIMILSVYFHNNNSRSIGFFGLLVACIIFIIPALLVVQQPDLGTALIIFVSGFVLLFICGVSMWFFISIIGCALVSLPLLWSMLHGYQKRRILTFLDSEQDALGAGYHITQSKIAIGSGGFFGKGYVDGSQSQLNFLPEVHTDFIFTLIGEEFGFIGSVFVLCLYGYVLFYSIRLSYDCDYLFGRFYAAGFSFMFFTYIFINVAMITGLIPVVGVPLPLISYGGTSMFNIFIAAAFLMIIAMQDKLNS